MVLCLGAISNCFAASSTLGDGYLNVNITLPQGNWIVKPNMEHGYVVNGPFNVKLGGGTHKFKLNQDISLLSHGSEADLYIENANNKLIAEVYVEQNHSTGFNAGDDTTRVEFGDIGSLKYITTSAVATTASAPGRAGTINIIVMPISEK
jgi:hypothetical protein